MRKITLYSGESGVIDQSIPVLRDRVVLVKIEHVIPVIKVNRYKVLGKMMD
jgi:hypothetical protein